MIAIIFAAFIQLIFNDLHILFSSQHLRTLMIGLRGIFGLKYSSARIRNCRIHVNSSEQGRPLEGLSTLQSLVPRQRGCSHFMTDSHYLLFSDIYYIFAVTAYRVQHNNARLQGRGFLKSFSFSWSAIKTFIYRVEVGRFLGNDLIFRYLSPTC